MASIKSKGYTIVIGEEAFRSINAFLGKSKYSSYYIICDENTLQHCLPLLVVSCPKLTEAHIIELESGEQSKSLDTAAMIWQTLLDNKADKSALILNLGGGVVSDLGGFCASVYKRGIDFIHIPTSLLAMADASVGSKTGIDLFNIKNAIGTFSEPKAVFIYPGFLKTLPQRHYKNGLAEVYKIALVANKELWVKLTRPDTKLNEADLIAKSVELKNKIVLKDPFDLLIRRSLNFGHSIGHALESLLLDEKDALLHGEAIVIGMMMESHIAYQKKLISKTLLMEVISGLRANFEIHKIPAGPLQNILSFVKNDKKNAKGKLLFSLIKGVGKPVWDISITEAQIARAIDHYNSLA